MSAHLTSALESPALTPTLGQHLQDKVTLLLIALGIFAVYTHATFRFPLNLPGHHGLSWMAILALSRQLSSYRWAATLTAGSAALASMIPAMGFHDPLVPLTYLAPGLVVDAVFVLLSTTLRRQIWVLAVLCGLAFATKPLLHYAAFIGADLPYSAMRQGLLYVIALHALFGFAGGVVGTGLGLRFNKR